MLIIRINGYIIVAEEIQIKTEENKEYALISTSDEVAYLIRLVAATLGSRYIIKNNMLTVPIEYIRSIEHEE